MAYYKFNDDSGNGWEFNLNQCGYKSCDACRDAFNVYLGQVKAGKRRWSKAAFKATPEEWRRELIGAFAIRGLWRE